MDELEVAVGKTGVVQCAPAQLVSGFRSGLRGRV